LCLTFNRLYEFFLKIPFLRKGCFVVERHEQNEAAIQDLNKRERLL